MARTSNPKTRNNITRKDFLKTVGAGAAAVGIARVGLASAARADTGEASAVVKGDAGGSLIGAVRLEVEKSYDGIPQLLAAYAQSGETDADSWGRIKAKIDYTYECIHHALKEVVLQDSVKSKIVAEVKSGKKLLFKPNLVTAQVFDSSGFGNPGPAILACTDWAFLAALMRWFHDKVGIDYTSMAVGDGSTTVPALAALLDAQFDYASREEPGGDYDKFTPEALIEGRVPMPTQVPGFPYPYLYQGYPFYFARKYLAETHDPTHTDDPLPGYNYSLCGNKAGPDGSPDPDGTYIPPGRRNYLSVEDLNFAESADRGRVLAVPGGGVNFPEGIEVHKMVVGDPARPADYPGCVLVSVPKLKVHNATMITNAVKNIGIGMYPTGATVPTPDNPHEFKYSYPHRFPPTYKSGVPHTIWETEVYDAPADPAALAQFFFLYGGMPDYSKPPHHTGGLQGTMGDIFSAVCNNPGAVAGKSMVALTLHVVDAVIATNVDHTGLFFSAPVRKGLALVSTDPVALDSFCANHMSKNVPRNIASAYGLEFALGVPMPRFDPSYGFISGIDGNGNPIYSYGAIVTDPGLDSPVLRNADVAYCEGRGLGSGRYHLQGMDLTSMANASLVTMDGHLGKIEHNAFVEIVYSDMQMDFTNMIWWLQGTSLSYAQATDSLPGGNSSYLAEFLSFDSPANGGNGDSIIDFTERGKKGYYRAELSVGSVGLNIAGSPGGMMEQGLFFINSRYLKYSEAAWNVGGVDTSGIEFDNIAVSTALSMAYGPEGMDYLFGLPIGVGGDGMAKWPSIQFARYLTEMSLAYGSGGMYQNAAAGAAVLSQAFGLPVSFRMYVPDKIPYAPSPPYNPYSLNYGAFWASALFPQAGIDPSKVAELAPGSTNYAALVFTVEFLGPDGNVLVDPATGLDMRW